MKKQIAFMIVVFLIALLCTGCLTQTPVKFKISFIVDGEIYSNVETDRSTVKMPDDPQKENFDFDGWFWDKDVWEKPFTLNSILDAPLSETFLIYAKFTSTSVNNIYSSFYTLQAAYLLGLLTYEDLFEVSFYHHGDWRGVPHGVAISRSAYPKNPEFLSSETENKIKQAFLDDYNYNTNYNNENYYTVDDIHLTYCGTFNNSVIVYVNGIYMYTEALWSERIAGITFYYGNGNFLRVWSPNFESANSNLK